MSGTVSTNLTPANGPGLAYTANDEEWTIAAGVLVASNDDDGVYSSFSDANLKNLGQVISGSGDDGVHFASNGLVENGSTGLIVGDQYGISVSGVDAADTGVVINAGAVQAGLYGVGISGQGSAIFSNSGIVSGILGGAFVTTVEGARVVNSGTIEGNYIGLAALTLGSDSTIEIINSGTIKLGNLIPSVDTGAIFAGGGGSVYLQNSGTIIGKVLFETSGGSARIDNSGLIDGETLLGDGNDTFDGSTGTQGFVFGEGGDDTLTGGAGDDDFDGGLGNDLLTGGGGADAFWFTTEPNTKTNRDTITDFSHADGDTIVLERDIFTGLGKNATKVKAKYFEIGKKPETKNDKIVYNEKSGVLMYAENGSKTDKADWIKFANLGKGTELDHGDILLV